MEKVIVLIAFNIISILLVTYNLGSSTQYINKDMQDIYEPFLYHLNDLSDRDLVIAYDFEVLKIYPKYILLEEKINKFSKRKEILFVITSLIWCFNTCCCIGIISAILVFIIIPLLIAALTFVLLLLFNKFFPQPEFDISKQKNEYETTGATTDFPLSKKDDLNVFLMSRHYKFLSDIYKEEDTRYTRVIIGCAFAALPFIAIMFGTF